MMEPILEIRTLCKRFEPGQWVIDNFSLTVTRGSLVCVLGPSGCGKTTLLRLICGFETPDRGEIVKEGEVISRPGYVVPPERRRVGMVFQDYALFPHLTVAENVGFGFGASKLTGLLPWRRFHLNRARPARAAARHGESGLKPDDLRERLAQLFELTGLAGLERRYPHEISGGQQQRVALARALAHRPHLVLLDEPFSNLDANLRRRLRDEVRVVLDRWRATSLLVSRWVFQWYRTGPCGLDCSLTQLADRTTVVPQLPENVSGVSLSQHPPDSTRSNRDDFQKRAAY